MVYQPKLIIPTALRNIISTHEIEAAKALSVYFRQEVVFLVPSMGYRMKTPDVLVGGAVAWEIKCPLGGSSRTTIQKQFRGLKQSRNLLIDGRNTKMTDVSILKIIQYERNRSSRRASNILYVNKLGEVIDCKYIKI